MQLVWIQMMMLLLLATTLNTLDLKVEKTCILKISSSAAMRLSGDCQEEGRRDGSLLYARFTQLLLFVATSIPPYRYHNNDAENSSSIFFSSSQNDDPELDTVVFALIDSVQSNKNATNNDRTLHLIFGDEWRIISAPISFMIANTTKIDNNNKMNITALAVGPVDTLMLILAIDTEGKGRLWHIKNNKLMEEDTFLTAPYFLTACIYIKNRMYAMASKTIFEVQSSPSNQNGFQLVALLHHYDPHNDTNGLIDEDMLRMMISRLGSTMMSLCCISADSKVKVFVKNEWRCIPTPSGGGTLKYQDEKAIVFEPCQPGTFASLETSCQPCPPGTVAPVQGAVTCSACHSTFSDGLKCLAVCPEHYKPEPCVPCPLEGTQWSAETKQCEPCPPMTAAAWGNPCALCSTVSGPGAKECAVFDQVGGDASSYQLYTLAHLPVVATAIAASAQNGTLWIAADGNNTDIIVLPQLFNAHFWEETSFRIANASGGGALALTHDEASLYAYNGGGTLVLIEMGSIKEKYAVTPSGYSMMCIGFWSGKNEERVYLKSGPNSIDAFWPGAEITHHLLPAEVDGFVAHTDGTLIVFFGGGPWKMWPSTGGLFPIMPSQGIQPNSIVVMTGYWDEDVPELLSKFNFDFTTTISQQVVSIISIDGGGKMLLFVDKGNVHAIYTRSIHMECNVNTYRHPLLPACLPCPANTYSDAGALACAPVCAPGFFRDDAESCVPCPSRGWWRSDSKFRACKPMQDTLAPIIQQSLYTYAEIQRFFPHATEIRCDFPLFDLLDYDEADIFKTGDMMGRFWQVSAPGAAGLMIQRRAVWVFCCSAKTSTETVCNCKYFFPEKTQLYGQCNDGGDLFRLDLNQKSFDMMIPVSNEQLSCWVGWPAQYSEATSAFFTCAAGFYLHYLPLAALQQRVCMRCNIGTYSFGGVVEKCTEHAVSACPVGEYIRLNEDATAEHVCVKCQQCAPDEMLLYLSAYLPFSDDERTLCTPGGVRQPYICASALDSIAGFFITLLQSPRQLHFEACATAPPLASVWATGPRPSACYFRCKYGINLAAVERYAAAALLTTAASLFISNNFFEYAVAASDEVCAPCPLCPEETIQVCGPPCLLKPWLCDITGCDLSARCGPIPENAVFKNVADCAWECKDGFLFSKARQCLPCLPSSCELGEAFSPESCTCSPCGGGNATERGICYCDPAKGVFRLLSSYNCLPCKTEAFCAAGMRVDQLCSVDPCGPCPEPYNTLKGTAVLTATFDGICRVQCKPGYHPIDSISGEIILKNEALDPMRVSCESCSLRPLNPCPSACFLGSAESTVTMECQKCMHNEDCPNAGTFAAPCTPGLPQPLTCIECSAAQPLRFFVAGSPEKCLTACIADSFEQQQACVPCSHLVMVPGAPFVKYYALFAAKPAARWWPPEFDPPHLPLRSMMPLLETRAGVCWPCPIGTLTHSSSSLEVIILLIVLRLKTDLILAG